MVKPIRVVDVREGMSAPVRAQWLALMAALAMQRRPPRHAGLKHEYVDE